MGLSESASLLKDWPNLMAPFIASLLLLAQPQRAMLLAPGVDPVPMPVVNSASYVLKPLPASWPAVQVANELIAGAKAQQLNYLESSHAEAIAALLAGPFNPAQLDEWQSWLLEGKDYLYVALCDDDLCEAITNGLLSLFDFLQAGALPTFSTLLSSLRMLFAGGNGSALCQSVSLGFLTSLFERGEPFSGAVYNLVSNFDAPLRSSPLSQLVARVESAYSP